MNEYFWRLKSSRIWGPSDLAFINQQNVCHIPRESYLYRQNCENIKTRARNVFISRLTRSEKFMIVLQESNTLFY